MSKSNKKNIAIVGAGVFGLSLALALRQNGHHVTVFDQHRYDETGYQPSNGNPELAASVDHNKIFRASYGTKLHYQRLALESREAWIDLNQRQEKRSNDIFVQSGMLRVQPTQELAALEKETLANMKRDGLRDTQFIKSDPGDRQRAADYGWEGKLLDFNIPDDPNEATFEAVLDSLAGFTRCSNACAFSQKVAEQEGVVFKFGHQAGGIASLMEEVTPAGKKKATGLKTRDGNTHTADVIVIAAGSFSTQLLPDLSYHLESSAGSVATFKIDSKETHLWEKYSPEKFPVLTWKSVSRNKDGKDKGSVYVFPRTPDGLVKIGYRGVKYTNFQNAPEDIPFTQDGKWSVPLPPADCKSLPRPSIEAIREFVSIFLPDFKDVPFHSTKLCWYTDSLDNSFVIDYVPTYADNSVFVCTGGSGHGAKFMPVLGKHAADILENGDTCTSPMRPLWRWRGNAPRKNGLEEGPGGPRNIAK